jgi:hypothetical protein
VTALPDFERIYSMVSVTEMIKRLPPNARELVKQNRRLINLDNAAFEGRLVRKQSLIDEINEGRSIASRHERDFIETGHAYSRKAQADAEAEVAEKTEELRELQNEPPQKQAIFTEDRLNEFIQRKSRVTWQPSIPDIKLKKSETAGSYLLKIREEVDATRKAIKNAEKAPLPVADAIERAKSNIKRVAASGVPNVRGTLQAPKGEDGRARQGDLEWPQAHVDGHWYRDGFALAVWLNQDLLIAKVTEEIKANARPGGLSLAERDSSIVESKAKLLQLERLEEQAFRLASIEDSNLERRTVCFEALLQIEPRATPSAATTEFD